MKVIEYKKEEITTEPPSELTYKNVIYWSASSRQLEGVKQGNAIVTKARRFIKDNLVGYNTETKTFYVLPIKNYNHTTYTINNRGDGHFECNCQFYNNISSKWEHPTCSHIQAVKFWLEIRRWNKLNQEEDIE